MSRLTCYGGNLEDVLLNRLFKGVENGFFVDIGSHHPRFSNNSFIFYERGWRGVNVEPTPWFHMLPQMRPLDTNVYAAITDKDGEVEFFFHPHSPATSSVVSEIRTDLGDYARDRERLVVPSMRMATLVEKYVGDRHVNFLSVDVEMAEALVFGSCDWTKFRPEVIIAEASPDHEQWSPYLTSAGYRQTLFDGINLWFVREESPHLIPLASVPVNALDNYEAYDEQKVQALDEVARLRTEVATLRQQIALAV
jgi:FkbM family methyltransferase